MESMYQLLLTCNSIVRRKKKYVVGLSVLLAVFLTWSSWQLTRDWTTSLEYQYPQQRPAAKGLRSKPSANASSVVSSSKRPVGLRSKWQALPSEGRQLRKWQHSAFRMRDRMMLRVNVIPSISPETYDGVGNRSSENTDEQQRNLNQKEKDAVLFGLPVGVTSSEKAKSREYCLYLSEEQAWEPINATMADGVLVEPIWEVAMSSGSSEILSRSWAAQEELRKRVLGVAYDQTLALDARIGWEAQAALAIKENMHYFTRKTLKIPKIIVQTTIGPKVTKGMRVVQEAWVRMNPDFGYRFFGDEQTRTFISENCSPRVLHAYEAVLAGAYKADLFRLCYLYANGGVYVDLDMMPGIPLSQELQPWDEFVSVKDALGFHIFNAFMASTPKHPLIDLALEMAVSYIELRMYSGGILDPTGPGCLGKAFEAYTKVYPVVGSYGKRGQIRLLRFHNTGNCGRLHVAAHYPRLFHSQNYTQYFVRKARIAEMSGTTQKFHSGETSVGRKLDYFDSVPVVTYPITGTLMWNRYRLYRKDGFYFDDSPHYSRLFVRKKLYSTSQFSARRFELEKYVNASEAELIPPPLSTSNASGDPHADQGVVVRLSRTDSSFGMDIHSGLPSLSLYKMLFDGTTQASLEVFSQQQTAFVSFTLEVEHGGESGMFPLHCVKIMRRRMFRNVGHVFPIVVRIEEVLSRSEDGSAGAAALEESCPPSPPQCIVNISSLFERKRGGSGKVSLNMTISTKFEPLTLSEVLFLGVSESGTCENALYLPTASSSRDIYRTIVVKDERLSRAREKVQLSLKKEQKILNSHFKPETREGRLFVRLQGEALMYRLLSPSLSACKTDLIKGSRQDEVGLFWSEPSDPKSKGWARNMYRFSYFSDYRHCGDLIPVELLKPAGGGQRENPTLFAAIGVWFDTEIQALNTYVKSLVGSKRLASSSAVFTTQETELAAEEPDKPITADVNNITLRGIVFNAPTVRENRAAGPTSVSGKGDPLVTLETFVAKLEVKSGSALLSALRQTGGIFFPTPAPRRQKRSRANKGKSDEEPSEIKATKYFSLGEKERELYLASATQLRYLFFDLEGDEMEHDYLEALRDLLKFGKTEYLFIEIHFLSEETFRYKLRMISHFLSAGELLNVRTNPNSKVIDTAIGPVPCCFKLSLRSMHEKFRAGSE